MDTNGRINLCEDYVSFEVAKLLKEKGMNKSCFKHYVQKNNNDGTSEAVTVCSLQMAMKWLREVYKYLIVVGNKNGNYLYLIKDLKSNTDLGISNNEYIRYEEACEEAIKYCLENLI